MRVLLHLPVARANNGGGAIAMWRLAQALAARGVSVRVSACIGTGNDLFGFRVEQFDRAVKDADILLTAAGEKTDAARKECARRGIPVVCCVHSAATPAWYPTRSANASLVLWGSAALEARLRDRGATPDCPSMVMWPLLDVDAVRVPRVGHRVTLVNLLRDKGANLFWRLPALLPRVQFLAVRGGWHAKRQVVPGTVPRNVDVMDFSPDVRRVYVRTRVLLYMRGPDSGLNWLNGVGMAAMEAGVSGIPTIAHPGAGLIESLGDTGTWVDSDQPEDWARAIQQTLRAERDAERSAAVRDRMAAIDQSGGVTELLTRMRVMMALEAAA